MSNGEPFTRTGQDDKPISFQELMALKQVDKDVFESQTPAWPPGSLPSVGKRAFGGHVYAQAVWAASKTVGKGLYVHNVTGHFLLAGMVDVPFTYHVKRLRDGGVYNLRSVEVFQVSNVADQGRTPCFVSTISFKRVESMAKFTPYVHQDMPTNHVRTEYDVVLRGRQITDHPHAPSADAEWKFLSDKDTLGFPGCEMRKVDMQAYNGVAEPGGGLVGEKVSKWRQLTFYRLLTDDDHHEDGDDLNLHAAAHLYASDRNGLFMVMRALGYDERHAFMGSLAHTVVFHGDPEAMRMVATDCISKWLVQEAWSSNSGANRVCHNSRLWDYDAGIVIATTMQDGMMRVPRDPPKL